ncbi:hypothetical protein IscW_ISCW000309 [Ixodes scapularis]|uniref:Uncharacterized protein n=1 Tax=Ixodes scapularis TaxID=6945 RepID=B7P379_IXOSC|nr:hypothetical protein IscW_ISCW000309 [Ixodes scapularis]|eukprot:XP_002403638.1 hypothetical protein IscW_ISCW000309 [Ixodes scapularis]
MPRGRPWRRGKEEADRRLPRGQKAADERTPARKRSCCRLRKTTRRSREPPPAGPNVGNNVAQRPGRDFLAAHADDVDAGFARLLPLGCLAAAGQSLLRLVCFSFSALVLQRLELESGEGR